MTTCELRNDAILRSRRRKLECLADSYAAALHEIVSMLHSRGRTLHAPRQRRSDDSPEPRFAGMTA